PVSRYNHCYELYALLLLFAHSKRVQSGRELEHNREDSLLTESPGLVDEKVQLLSQTMKWPLPIFLAPVTLVPVDCSSRFLLGDLLLMRFGMPARSSRALFSNLLSPPRCDQGSYMHLQ